jgi:hypothetical protein
MRCALRLALALAFLAAWAMADDIQNRRPDAYWIPGWLEGEYGAELDIATLPDVIVATLTDRTPVRTITDRTPIRTLEKR